MGLYGVCAALLLCASAARAQPSRPASSVQTATIADDRLRVWLTTDPKVREKITRTQDATPVFVEPVLKDAVSDGPSMQAPLQLGCRDFTTCLMPPLALDLPAGANIEAAIRAMVRPWIWLADAKGVRLGVAPARPESQSILLMNIQGLSLSGVGLNITPRKGGGVRLWFSRGSELAALYAREHAALPAVRP
jgi:hypothetical protein